MIVLLTTLNKNVFIIVELNSKSSRLLISIYFESNIYNNWVIINF